MRWLVRLRMLVEMLFRRGRAADRLDKELHFHLDQQVAENIAAAMSPEEARHAALRAFGNPTSLRDEARQTWSWNGVESMLRDLRIAVRTLLRAPGFALAAILVMGLGIGANVALFTVVHAVLLKPLPLRDPDRLMRLYEKSTFGDFPYKQSAAGVFAEWKKQSRSFSDMALAGYAGYNLSGIGSGTGGQLPENVRAGVLSWNMLPTLGFEPALGELHRGGGPAVGKRDRHPELGIVEAALRRKPRRPEPDDTAGRQALHGDRRDAGVVCLSGNGDAVVDSALSRRAVQGGGGAGQS